MASGVIVLDSEGGVIQVRDPANVSTGDFIKIETGDITTYKYLNGSYRSMKSLRKNVWWGWGRQRYYDYATRILAINA